MLVTLVQDAYQIDERAELAEAIDAIASPSSCAGWSSAGVYCYWDYDKKQVLYIGLAVDLAQRFRQHNGLAPCRPGSCKLEKINGYFQTHGILGFSMLMQSSLDQPFNARSLAAELGLTKEEAAEFPSQEGQANIEFAEGALIEACRKKLGAFAPWNKVSGNTSGREAADLHDFTIVQWLCGGNAFLVARSRIRELANNPTLERYEQFLHALRISVYGGMSLEAAIRLQEECGNPRTVNEIIEAGYLDKAPPFAD